MKQLVSLTLVALLVYGSIPIVLVGDEPILRGRGTVNIGEDIIDTEIDIETTTPSAITLTAFDKLDPADAVAFTCGTSLEEISERLDFMFGYFYAYDAAGNDYYLLPETWSISAEDINTPGLYFAWAEPNLDHKFVLADGLSLPRQVFAISLQTSGRLDIDNVVLGRGYLRFPWVFSPEQDKLLKELEELGQQDSFADVWLRQDHREWVQLSEGVSFISDALELSQNIFQVDSIYDLQVDYPGGQTGILTFEYNQSLSIINYAEGSRDGGNVSGEDSSSGSQPAPIAPSPSIDREPNNSVDDSNSDHIYDHTYLDIPVVVPADKPESQDETESPNHISLQDYTSRHLTGPTKEHTSLTDILESVVKLSLIELSPLYSHIPFAPKVEDVPPILDTNYIEIAHAGVDALPALIPVDNEPVENKPMETDPIPEEFYSPEETIISGLRLRDLCQDEEKVVFGSGDLTVSIPSDLLLALNLSDFHSFSVKLTQPGSKQVKLEVKASDHLIEKLSGATLRLRHTPESENPDFIIRNKENTEISDLTFDGEFLHFTSDTNGIYTILETPHHLEPQKAVLPILPVLGGLAVAGVGGGILFFRRKRRG